MALVSKNDLSCQKLFIMLTMLPAPLMLIHAKNIIILKAPGYTSVPFTLIMNKSLCVSQSINFNIILFEYCII